MQVHSALLVAVAAELDWDACDHHIGQLQALRRGAGGGDLDSGRCLRMAADRSAAAGELRRAHKLRWLARDLLVCLDRPEELMSLDLQLGAPAPPRTAQAHGQMD
jgi:hypothetical protein